jgi:hypothetical protein
MFAIAAGVEYDQDTLDDVCPSLINDWKFGCFQSITWDILINMFTKEIDEADIAPDKLASYTQRMGGKPAMACRSLSCSILGAVHLGAQGLVPSRRRDLGRAARGLHGRRRLARPG